MSSSSIDILLAEDDEDLREAMVETLSDAGYRVEAVANGRDALEWFEDTGEAPKLILLDLMMPIMDGWQFLEARDRAPNVAAVPVMVLSANGTFSGVNSTVAYMKKPVAVEPLLSAVAGYCAAGAASK